VLEERRGCKRGQTVIESEWEEGEGREEGDRVRGEKGGER
jgi:hypothetical protein